MLKIFLSYAHEDLVEATRLYETLDAVPAVDVWFDRESLLPGEKWEQATRRAIRQCRFFLLLLSSRSVAKKGLYQKEIRIALDILDEFPDDEIFLIPIRLDACRPSFDRLTDLQYVDLFPDWNAGVRRVLQTLETHRRQATETASPQRLRFTTHQARFVSNPTLHYFLNISNLSPDPLRITHIWYEDGTHHIPVQRDSRPLPKKLEPSEAWASWIAVGRLPQNARLNAYEHFRLRLSTGDVFASVKESSIPPYGSVPGGSILEDEKGHSEPGATSNEAPPEETT